MYGKDIVTTNGALVAAIGGASTQITSTLVAGKLYSFTTNTSCWIKQGFGAQTAAIATANNVLVPAGGTVYIHGSNGTHVSVIQDTAPGNCSINLMTEI
jgi:hypothetical protein